VYRYPLGSTAAHHFWDVLARTWLVDCSILEHGDVPTYGLVAQEEK